MIKWSCDLWLKVTQGKSSSCQVFWPWALGSKDMLLVCYVISVNNVVIWPFDFMGDLARPHDQKITAVVSDHFPIIYAFKLKAKLDIPKTQFLYKRIINENLIKAFTSRLHEFSWK